MKTILLNTLLIVSAIFSQAQAQNFVWAKSMGGTGLEFGTSIKVDGLGNVYTTGYFSNTVDFDPGVGVFNLTSAGSEDIFISKLDATGNFVWAKQIGGTGSDIPNSIVVDGLGNVYTTGYFNGTVDFNPGAGVVNLTSLGGQDIFITKLDATGNFVWAKQIGGNSNDVANSIVVDGLGNVYTTGYFNGTADFNPGVGVFNLTSGSFDVFISKLDATGNFVWAKQIGGTGTDRATSIAVDGLGNVYTTGYFNFMADFDPGAGVDNLTPVGNNDVFISKLDATGNFVWAKQIGGTGNDIAYSIALDGSGNVYTTGYFNTIVDFDPGAGVVNLTSVGNDDVFVSKLDATGNFVWAKKMGGGSVDFSFYLALDGLGNIYISGNFQGTADFDPGAGVANLISLGGKDIFVTKLDATGNFVWAKSIEGALGDDVGYSLALDGAGNVYTTGYFQGTADFDPGVGVANLTAVGGLDFFVLKLTQSLCTTPTVNISAQTNVSCNGGANGSATISATGDAPFTYTWSPSGGNLAIASGLSANNYSCVVTNSCGTTATQTVTITQPSVLSLTAVANNTSICAGTSSTLTANGTGGTGAINYTWVAGSTTSVNVVSPTSSSIFTVNIMDANSCSKTETISVAVNTLPTLTVNSGAICLGNTFTITPSGASTYTYSSGSNEISPLSNQTYTVIGESTQGCTNTAVSNVTVNALPIVNATSNNTIICVGQTANLTATGATSYTWNTSETTPVIVITPTNTTTYTLIGIDNNGCIGSTTITQNVSTCTGINAVNLNKEQEIINIFPNPSNGSFTIELINYSKITITNALGQEVMAITCNEGTHTLNLNNEINGVYFIKVISGNTQTTKRLVINK